MIKFSRSHRRGKTIIMTLRSIIANRVFVGTKLLSRSINKLSSAWGMKRLTANEMIALSKVFTLHSQREFLCNGGLSSSIVIHKFWETFLSSAIIFHRSNRRSKRWDWQIGRINPRITIQRCFFLVKLVERDLL